MQNQRKNSTFVNELPLTTERLGDESGFSFLELLIAVAVFVLGLSALLGTMMNLTPHRQSADARARATNYASSTFEELRDLSLSDILAYEAPVDNQQTNSVNISGLGPVTVELYAVVPGGFGQAPTLYELGSAAAGDVDQSTLPNPIEVRAVMSPLHGEGDESTSMQITASTLIPY